MSNKIKFDPVTLRECFGYWFFWRFTAAHKFCCDCMRTGKATRAGNQNILQAPTFWYFDRFIAAWKLGKPYIVRARREMRRPKSVKTEAKAETETESFEPLENPNMADAISALCELGGSKRSARASLAGAPADLDLSELVSYGLKYWKR